MTRAAALAAAGVLALAGCGGDDDNGKQPGADTATEKTATTDTAPTRTAPATETEPARTGQEGGGAKAPGENQPGGAGDEVPNSTQALITGRAGKLSPATVSVPPFIAITVELRSADGRDYALRGGGRSLAAGEGRNSATASFDGPAPGAQARAQRTAGTGHHLGQRRARPVMFGWLASLG